MTWLPRRCRKSTPPRVLVGTLVLVPPNLPAPMPSEAQHVQLRPVRRTG